MKIDLSGMILALLFFGGLIGIGLWLLASWLYTHLAIAVKWS